MITIHWLLLLLGWFFALAIGYGLCSLNVAASDRPMHPRFNGEHYDNDWESQKH